jgi:hypothetical protein
VHCCWWIWFEAGKGGGRTTDGIRSYTVGLCCPLYDGYKDIILEDNILEDIILEHHLRLTSYHMLVILTIYKYVTPIPQIDMILCEK